MIVNASGASFASGVKHEWREHRHRHHFGAYFYYGHLNGFYDRWGYWHPYAGGYYDRWGYFHPHYY